MPFTPSVKEEEDSNKTVKKANPVMDAAIKRRMKMIKPKTEDESVVKTKKVGY